MGEDRPVPQPVASDERGRALVFYGMTALCLILVLLSFFWGRWVGGHDGRAALKAAAQTQREAQEELDAAQAEDDSSTSDLHRIIDSPHFVVTSSWPASGHIDFIKRNGASLCFGCHKESVCSDCHVKMDL